MTTLDAAGGSPVPQRRARVLIVDDHDVVRAGLRDILAGEPELLVVAEASSGREALDCCGRHAPDLVLMDVLMPDLDGLAATRAIRHEWAQTAVLIFTGHDTAECRLAAARAGAAGYVHKSASRAQLLAAVRRALAGPGLPASDPPAGPHATPSHGPPALTSAGIHLSVREREVLELVAQGLTNREIAHRLEISPGTVKVHVEHIIARLGATDRTQAAVRALELGLVGGFD